MQKGLCFFFFGLYDDQHLSMDLNKCTVTCSIERFISLEFADFCYGLQGLGLFWVCGFCFCVSAASSLVACWTSAGVCQ